ncbi:MAG: hypothetical protein ACLGJB_24175 [Blastocatellia bacterium]
MFRIIVILMLLVFAGGCKHQPPLEDVDKAAALFFQRLNDAEYDAIYKDASTRLKTNKTRDAVVESLKELTARGRLQEHRRINTSYQEQGKDRIATPVYSTFFEQSRGELAITFIDEGGEWKLIAFEFKLRG